VIENADFSRKIFDAEDVKHLLGTRFIGKEANFSMAEFPDVDFSESIFDCKANFKGANFKGRAIFEATVWNSSVDFENATFGKGAKKGAKCSFKGATFSCRELNEQVLFKGAEFAGDRVIFENVKFAGGVDFSYADFSDVKLRFADKDDAGLTKIAGWSFDPKFKVSFNEVKFSRKDGSKGFDTKSEDMSPLDVCKAVRVSVVEYVDMTGFTKRAYNGRYVRDPFRPINGLPMWKRMERGKYSWKPRATGLFIYWGGDASDDTPKESKCRYHIVQFTDDPQVRKDIESGKISSKNIARSSELLDGSGPGAAEYWEVKSGKKLVDSVSDEGTSGYDGTRVDGTLVDSESSEGTSGYDRDDRVKALSTASKTSKAGSGAAEGKCDQINQIKPLRVVGAVMRCDVMRCDVM
jgi:uncharacterized protein YjbI with pentapeptide repeats